MAWSQSSMVTVVISLGKYVIFYDAPDKTTMVLQFDQHGHKITLENHTIWYRIFTREV